MSILFVYFSQRLYTVYWVSQKTKYYLCQLYMLVYEVTCVWLVLWQLYCCKSRRLL